MTRIGVRELRQHASRYLDQVKAGHVVEVTERGEFVALLVAPTPVVAERDRLIASGRLVPAQREFRLPERRHVSGGDHTACEALAELRRDRNG